MVNYSIILIVGLVIFAIGFIMFVAGGINNAMGHDTKDVVFDTSMVLGNIGIFVAIGFFVLKHLIV